MEVIDKEQKASPFITITDTPKGLEISTNLPPEARPMLIWLIEQAKLTILTKASEQEKAQIVKPSGINGLIKKMTRH